MVFEMLYIYIHTDTHTHTRTHTHAHTAHKAHTTLGEMHTCSAMYAISAAPTLGGSGEAVLSLSSLLILHNGNT